MRRPHPLRRWILIIAILVLSIEVVAQIAETYESVTASETVTYVIDIGMITSTAGLDTSVEDPRDSKLASLID